jgi:hypothetical protein
MCAHPSSHEEKKAAKRDTRARAAAQHPLEADATRAFQSQKLT